MKRQIRMTPEDRKEFARLVVDYGETMKKVARLEAQDGTGSLEMQALFTDANHAEAKIIEHIDKTVTVGG